MQRLKNIGFCRVFTRFFLVILSLFCINWRVLHVDKTLPLRARARARARARSHFNNACCHMHPFPWSFHLGGIAGVRSLSISFLQYTIVQHKATVEDPVETFELFHSVAQAVTCGIHMNLSSPSCQAKAEPSFAPIRLCWHMPPRENGTFCLSVEERRSQQK